MATIYDQTELTAEGVTAQVDVWVGLQDRQNAGNAGKRMSLLELLELVNDNITVGAITWSATDLPATNAAAGLYGVVSGTYRGLYICSGTERIRLVEFSQDGA